jgi:hypothetical protein
MTIWRARPALRGDRTRLLCGRRVQGVYDCHEVVAWRYEIATSDGPFVAPDFVVLPDGLTDVGTPSEYRWSSHARGRIARGEDPRRDKRSGPRQAKPPGIAGTAQVLAGEGPKGFHRPANVPLTLPCARGHVNRVDGELLVG